MLQLPRASQRLPESSGLRWQPTKPDVRPHTAGRWRQTAGRSCHPAQPASSAAVHSADPALISEVACQARSSPGGDLGLAFQALLHKFGSKGPSAQPYGARVVVDAMSYQPPAAPGPIVKGACLDLPANSLGLLFGRSGSGKTTLLHVLAGLLQPTAGAISLQLPSGGLQGPITITSQRAAHVGLVFQFPERHFLGHTLFDELTFGWPSTDFAARQRLAMDLPEILSSVGLQDVPLETPLQALSGGLQRRASLAVALARKPRLLLLDEPLSGLDWRACSDIAAVLRSLKQRCTVLMISHNLGEVAPLVDHAWRMQMGGVLEPAPVPTTD